MKKIAIVLLLLASLPCIAQTDNTFYPKQFKGTTVGAKVTAAQGACNSDTAISCIIVFDPSLAVLPVGTMPAKCAQCIWLDFRFPNSGGASITGVSEVIPGVNITCSPDVSGSCTGAVTINAGSGLETMQAPPPSTSGQYVIVPGIATLSGGGGNEISDVVRGFMYLQIDPNWPVDDDFYADQTFVWSIAPLPSYVASGTITAIYAAVSIENDGGSFTTGCPVGPIAGQVHYSADLGTAITYTCSGNFGSNRTLGFVKMSVNFFVYYTGAAPPIPAVNPVSVNFPLDFNPALSTMSFSLPYDFSADSGTADAVAISLAAFAFQPINTAGNEVKFVPAYANASTTPTLNLNGLGAETITKCGQNPLVPGDYVTTEVADVINDGTNWELQNPLKGCGGTTGGVTASGNNNFTGANTFPGNGSTHIGSLTIISTSPTETDFDYGGGLEKPLTFTTLYSGYSTAGETAGLGPNEVLGWNNGSGHDGLNPWGDVGFSRDSAGILDCGNGALKDQSCVMKFAGQVGPTSAPSSSCATNGEWVFSQDGHASFCNAGTWVVKI